ncbi:MULTISPECIES: hypothetical protein [Vibrio]|uniref:Type III secretion protein n=1 Tax=Vibrio coralliilyticus TaxID=190893 RepID=A0AAP6ZSB9_9VIBR|nr:MULTISPECIES: hypothetical protein [Vibrio]EEX34227.1 hypothetical protein VIC_001021 [Vibrio coralliilyticus ATCC BAA-450]MDE3898633.1 hypothetical protein [Vibrio sp. CC007]NOJ24253.1 hypothetical protein [Vibrio coralliilyticus]
MNRARGTIIAMVMMLIAGCAANPEDLCTYDKCRRPLSTSEHLVVWIDETLREQPTHFSDDFWQVAIENDSNL